MANYVSVTWTSGDIITEAKLDNMVSNDQAEDAHPSLRLTEISAPSTPASNTAALYLADKSGVSTLYLKSDAGVVAELGSVTFNTQTDNYTLVLADHRKIIIMNKGTANNLTVDTNANVPYPLGTVIGVIQIGAGQTTIVAAGGVTINSVSTLKMKQQYAVVILIKRASDTWALSGDLASS